ncbi:MAG: CAP domain-containing protein [Acidobacteriota bacterium]|nr:CAP domain-containing protein [Acidobacteriota bacterium]
MLALLLGAGCTRLLAAEQPLTPQRETAAIDAFATPSIGEQYLMMAANLERQQRGLSELRWDPVLARAAAFHAGQMADHGNISHQFEGEPDLETRGADAGLHFSQIAENVALADDPVLIHDLWMNSDGHRENLLNPTVTAIGIAVVVRDGDVYAVEDFATTVETLSIDAQETAVASLVQQSGIRVDNDGGPVVEDARKTCAMPTGHAGSRKPWFIMRYTSSSLDVIPAELKHRLDTGKYREAAIGACPATDTGSFTAYTIAVLLYP